MLFCSKAFRARCFRGQRNATGNTVTERTVLAGKDKLTSTTLLSDQRGAVAFETLIVWLFMMMSLLLPLADIAIAGFQFISAWQALRGFGQYAQYHSPQAVAKLPATVAGYPIKSLQVLCGVAPCFQATVFRPSTIRTRRPSPCRPWC